MAFAPVTFTRIDANHYIVGAVHLRRMLDDGRGPGMHWAALPHNDTTRRPLFTASTLEEILELAHGGVEMMRPA